VTLARWFFGGRKVACDAGCRLDEAARTVHFRELVKETSWGIPAPFFVAEKAPAAATRAAATRLEDDVDAGLLEFDRIREAIEHAVREAGWLFQFDAGRP
jgi:hypothetical protein